MKYIILFLAFFISNRPSFSQTDSLRKGKKPTVMIKPSNLWLNKNNYLKLVDNQGVTVNIPDYNKALIENVELKLVIAAINNLYTERSFPLKSLEQVLKNIQSEDAELIAITSKSGSNIDENLIDKIRRNANADIELDLTWELTQNGPQKSITLIIEALDTYTGKSIASVTGIGRPSFNADIQNLLKEAILANIDNFNSQLQKYFDDIIENGRETVLKISVFGDSEFDLESSVKSNELSFEGDISEFLEKWLDINAVKSQYNTSSVTDKSMLFEQVRIPLFNKDGIPIDSRRFYRGIIELLQKTDKVVPAKLISRGLGEVRIVIGQK
jgi:hypothetical protein